MFAPAGRVTLTTLLLLADGRMIRFQKIEFGSSELFEQAKKKREILAKSRCFRIAPAAAQIAEFPLVRGCANPSCFRQKVGVGQYWVRESGLNKRVAGRCLGYLLLRNICDNFKMCLSLSHFHCSSISLSAPLRSEKIVYFVILGAICSDIALRILIVSAIVGFT